MKTKPSIFHRVSQHLLDLGLSIKAEDTNKPWGGFFVMEETQIDLFSSLFFPEETNSLHASRLKLSPKILLISPQKRLSWQYHFRRAEIWRCISGTVGVVTGPTDVEASHQTLGVGDNIRILQGERHRAIGLQDWGVIAEIWQHTDPRHPSDEQDIVRVQDDFAR